MESKAVAIPISHALKMEDSFETDQPAIEAVLIQEIKLSNAIATEQLAELYKLNTKTDNIIRITYIIIGMGIACLLYFMTQ